MLQNKAWARRRIATVALAVVTLAPVTGLRTSAQQTPHPADPGRQSALLLEQEGHLQEAEAAWQAYARIHPRNAEPYARIALLEVRQEHFAQAVPYYRKALAISPNAPGLRLNLGLAFFKSGDMKSAITEFAQVLHETPPNTPEAQRLTILLGMAHYGLAQYAEAVPFLKTSAARDPQNLPLRLALAHSCLWSKQYPCVLDVYHQILQLNAESAEADMLAGEALDEMKDTSGAIEQFRAAVKANPNEPNVHFGLGYLYWSQRQYAEAEPEFKMELANDPQHAQSMLYLGDLYLQSNRAGEAASLLEKAAQIDSSLWRAHLDLGILYADQGRNDDALRELQIAARQQPEDVNVHWRLARLYRAMGRTADAKTELEKASSLHKATDEGLVKKMTGAQPTSPAKTVPASQNP